MVLAGYPDVTDDDPLSPLEAAPGPRSRSDPPPPMHCRSVRALDHNAPNRLNTDTAASHGCSGANQLSAPPTHDGGKRRVCCTPGSRPPAMPATAPANPALRPQQPAVRRSFPGPPGSSPPSTPVSAATASHTGTRTTAARHPRKPRVRDEIRAHPPAAAIPTKPIPNPTTPIVHRISKAPST